MPQPQPTARRQLEFAKRQGVLVILVTVVAICAAAAGSFTQQKVYRASTKIVVGQAGGIFQPQFGNAFQPFTQTMTSLLKSDVVATTVIRDLGLNETPESLLANVRVSSTPGSAVLQVSFDSHNRADAVKTLRRMASAFTALVRQKLGGPQDKTKTGAIPPITATVFDPAHASSTPILPRPARTLAFAGIIGLFLGLTLALLRDALDDRLRGRDELEEHFAAPVIAALPKSMLGRRAVESKNRRFPRADPQRRANMEALDSLRMQLSRNGVRGRLVVITSSVSGEGKSSVAANLGVALASAGQDVICIDADPTQPGLSYYFDLPQGDGDGFPSPTGRFDLGEALRDVYIRNGPEDHANGPGRGANEQVDPARDWSEGAKPAAGRSASVQLLFWGKEQEAISHQSIAEIAVGLKDQSAYVLVDAPPLPAGTTLSLLSVADETIVVARAQKTTKEQARFVRQTLQRLRVPSYSIVSIR